MFLQIKKKLIKQAALLQSINNEIINLTTINLNTIKAEIKKLQKYNDAFKNGGTLKGDLTLLKGLSVASAFAHDDVITVKGKIKFGDVEKDFTFTVKIDDFTNQERVDDAVEKIQSLSNVQKTFSLPTADLNADKLKNAIKNSEVYQDTFKDVELVNNDLNLERPAGTALTTAVNDNEVITVKGKVKVGTSTDKKEKAFTFNVKVDELTDQEKVNKAVTELKKIDNMFIPISTVDLSNPVAPIKEVIKRFKQYQDIIKDGVTLEKENTAITSVVHDDQITIKGEFKVGDVKESFELPGWIDELTNQRKITKTVEQLQAINDEIITLTLANLNIENLKTAIKELDEYENAFEDDVLLKNDRLDLTKDGKTVLLLYLMVML